MLDVSRPTLVQIEAGNRNVKVEEIKKLSEIFDISTDYLLWIDTSLSDVQPNEKDIVKFKHLILYILSKVGAKFNVGKVVLYKLLYFAEFDFYEKYHKKLTWFPFIKLPMWPAPLNFDTLIAQMSEEKEITTVVVPYGTKYQQRFIVNVEIPENRFTREESKNIDEVLERYSDYGANEISELSHQDRPRQLAQEMNIISYDTVKFREYPFSPLARDNKKRETQEFLKRTKAFDDLADEPDLYEDYR